MALKSRKIPIGLWAASNFFIGYLHQKALDTDLDSSLQGHEIFNNLVFPLLLPTGLTARDATIGRKELSRYQPGDPRRESNPFMESKDIYLENLVGKATLNYLTSIVPYVAGRLTAKII